MPAPYGWDLRLLDGEGMDLSQITPPYRFAPNPREIYGWHFRNADNTDANTGDVNAPQHSRIFQFSSSLTGTGGFKPSSSGGAVNSVAEDSEGGRGMLRIIDMGLSDLEPDVKARITYLKFEICLNWSKTAAEGEGSEEENSKQSSSTVFLNEEQEMLFSCGLNSDEYQLTAWVLPRMLNGDMDGDGNIDG